MSIRSLGVTLVVLFVITVVLNFSCTSQSKRCAIAKMEIETYEECGRTRECTLSSDERRYLIYARADEIKWCKESEHE